jgi:hypothetical protein
MPKDAVKLAVLCSAIVHGRRLSRAILRVHVAFLGFSRPGPLRSNSVLSRPRPAPPSLPRGPFPQCLGCRESLPQPHVSLAGGLLLNAKPDTFIPWQRKGFRLFWRLPKHLRQLLQQMAADNPIWGQERIANELKLKLGIRVSPVPWASTCSRVQDARPIASSAG